MSNLIVSNFGDGTLTVPATAVTEGTDKAYAYIDGGATPNLQTAYNVSSVTDDGAGEVQTNLTNAVADAKYPFASTAESLGPRVSTVSDPSVHKLTTECRTFTQDLAGTGQDVPGLTHQYGGNLA